jgi:hypothetical protein
MSTPFMTEAEFDALEPLMSDGWATLGEFYATSIAIVRQDGTAVGTFFVVSIDIANRVAITTGAGTPMAETELGGTLRLWTEDVTDFPVWRGDRFIWNGHNCVISTPGSRKRGGVAEYGFTLAGRNV